MGYERCMHECPDSTAIFLLTNLVVSALWADPFYFYLLLVTFLNCSIFKLANVDLTRHSQGLQNLLGSSELLLLLGKLERTLGHLIGPYTCRTSQLV